MTTSSQPIEAVPVSVVDKQQGRKVRFSTCNCVQLSLNFLLSPRSKCCMGCFLTASGEESKYCEHTVCGSWKRKLEKFGGASCSFSPDQSSPPILITKKLLLISGPPSTSQSSSQICHTVQLIPIGWGLNKNATKEYNI